MARPEKGTQSPEGTLELAEEVKWGKLLESMREIGARLITQDNRATAVPMFCVQIVEVTPGLPVDWTEDKCWYDPSDGEWYYDSPPRFVDDSANDEDAEWIEEWIKEDGSKMSNEEIMLEREVEEYSYGAEWVTRMVAFTEQGCLDYLKENGHNLRNESFSGRVRIYAESFYRCREMIAVREFLIKNYERENRSAQKDHRQDVEGSRNG